MHSRRRTAAVIMAVLACGASSHAAIVVNTDAYSNSTNGSIPTGSTATPSPFYSGESFGATSGSFGTPTINSAGSIVFIATTVGTGAVTTTTANGSSQQNNQAIYTSTSAATLSLAAHGDAYAPTYTGLASSTANSGQFLNFTTSISFPAIDNNGNLFTFATLQSYTGAADSSGTSITASASGSHGPNNTGLYSGASGTFDLSARNSDGPILDGSTNYWFKSLNSGTNYSADVNPVNGDYVEVVNVGTNPVSTTTGLTSGILQSSSTGTLSIIATNTDTAPGTGGSPFYSYTSGATVSIKSQTINSSGQVAFVDSFGNSTTNTLGIFSQGGGTLHLVQAAGASAPAGSAPATAGDIVINSAAAFGNIDFNNAGQTVFSATLSNGTTGDVTTGVTGNNYALYVETPSTTGGASTYSLVARKGDSAPGISGANFESTNSPFGSPIINHNGQVVFTASLTGTGITSQTPTNASAIYEYTPGAGTQLLVQSGSAAPGTSGDLFGSFLYYDTNSNGVVLFADTLQTGTGNVTTSNNTGIWAVDSGGSIFQIIRKGETGAQFGLPSTSPFYSDYVSSFAGGYTTAFNSGGEDGRYYDWNDSNTLGLEVYFVTTLGGSTAAGSGEFTVAVPEPASLGLILLPALTLLGRRNRKSKLFSLPQMVSNTSADPAFTNNRPAADE